MRAAFGDRVADLVGWVTIPEAADGADKKAVKEAYLTRLADAPDDAILVKLADRASNVQTLRNLSLPKQRRVLRADRRLHHAARGVTWLVGPSGTRAGRKSTEISPSAFSSALRPTHTASSQMASAAG